MKGENKTIYLKDYKPHAYKIHTVDLEFDLSPNETKVTTRLKLKRQAEGELVLDGIDLKLLKVVMNGKELSPGDYRADDQSLTILNPDDNCILETEVLINPEGNTSLEGLYLSDGAFCTQNEAQGFRKITYYIDRPDCLAVFTTKIIADKKEFPILLSNGNRVESGDLDGGKHFATWKDPFPKPAYLYALVAGDLEMVADTFTTKSGRNIDLEIYVDKGNSDKCNHAMESLKNSMKWDEDVFGLEYDLDIYMIVAVDAFNMGAMENKGLNIFNSKYVLAKNEIATDRDFEGIEGVIGHEYFHNWTGNRVTCRDWFQLTLKEGLTVFRDQEFSADMGSRAVKRIDDVKVLRAHQFKEDAGPMKHPIRPKSFMEISNFYTATIYEKGSEVIRMLHTIVGAAGFRAGMDKYFELYDGGAVTTEDFVHAHEVANNIDLTQFKRWYDQVGTPKLKVADHFDNGVYTLELEQSLVEHPENHGELILHIPMKIAMYDYEGNALETIDENGKKSHEHLLHFRNKKQSFSFKGIDTPSVVLSINRGFTAPVNIDYHQSDEDLCVLMGSDLDAFNKWDAGQRLMNNIIFRYMDKLASGELVGLSPTFKTAFAKLIENADIDPKFYAYALETPSVSEISNLVKVPDFDLIFKAIKCFRVDISKEFKDQISKLYQECEGALKAMGEFKIDPRSMGFRAVKNVLLGYLSEIGEEGLVYEQYESASNMTEKIAAFSMIVSLADSDKRTNAISEFAKTWKDESLVINKWFAALASSERNDVLESVKVLESHELFDIKNPNKVRALIGAFKENQVAFNNLDGSGYRYIAGKVIELDELNPQIASRLATAFSRIKNVDKRRNELMTEELEKIKNTKGLSKDTFEVVSKYLS